MSEVSEAKAELKPFEIRSHKELPSGVWFLMVTGEDQAGAVMVFEKHYTKTPALIYHLSKCWYMPVPNELRERWATCQ